jgi:hypothetical protein
VDVADNQVTAVLPALRWLLADPFEGQDNLFVAVELGDDGEVDSVLIAAPGETQARSPRCQPTVVTSAGTTQPRSRSDGGTGPVQPVVHRNRRR